MDKLNKRQLGMLRSIFEKASPWFNPSGTYPSGQTFWAYASRNAVVQMRNRLHDAGYITNYDRDTGENANQLTSKGLEALIQHYAQRDEFDELQKAARAALVERVRHEQELTERRNRARSEARRRAEEQRKRDKERTRTRVRQVFADLDTMDFTRLMDGTLEDDKLDQLAESLGDAIIL